MDVDPSTIAVARNDALNELDNATDQRLKEEEEEYNTTFINEKI
jgi:hypothetical protein